MKHKVFFFFLLVFLPTQLGYHFWPEWAYVLGRRVDYLSPIVYVTDLLLVLTVGSWVIEKWRSGEVAKAQISLGKLGRFGVVGIFVAANIFLAASPLVAVYKWVKVSEFLMLGYYIVKTKPTLAAIGFPLTVAVLYSSVIAIAQFVLQHSVGGPLWWLGERAFDANTPGIARINLCQASGITCQEMLRAYGTFPHPNVLGGFLAAMIPLLVYQFTNPTNLPIRPISKTWRRRIFYGATLLFGVVGLGLTFSRSAIVVGVAMMIVMVARIANWELRIVKKQNWIPAFAGMTAGVVGVTIGLIVILFFLLPVSPGDESVVVRQQLNTVAIKQWLSSPIVGVGLGNFLVTLPATMPTRVIYFLQPVHNVYLLLLSEIGVVGVVGIVWALINKSVGASKLRSVEEKKSRNLATSQPRSFMLLSLVTLLLLGLVDHYPLTLQQGQLLVTIFVALNVVKNAK